jgi:hypothetical protein
MARKDPQLNIRMPEDLLYWLRQVAKENERSITGQVIVAVRKMKQEEEQKRERTT